MQLNSPSVEGEQATSGVCVRQVDFDCDVDSAGSGGQCWLEQVRPVGGQNEEQIGVRRGAVHCVEQFKEHRG